MPRTLQIALSFFVATPIEVVVGVDFGGGRTSANKDINCLIGGSLDAGLRDMDLVQKTWGLQVA